MTDSVARMKTGDLLRVALLAALTAVGAWVRIPVPFTPVPFTLQVFFVLLAGMTLGANLGALSQLVYILLGVIGLPVFAGGQAGIGTLFGPTGGYLISWPIAAYIIGRVWELQQTRSYARGISAFAGIVVIYVLGVAQLAVVAKLSVWSAILSGAMPFIPLDLVKAALATMVAHRLRAAGFALVGGASKAARELGSPEA